MFLKIKKKLNRLYYTLFGYGVNDIIDGKYRPPLKKCKPKERLEYIGEMRRLRSVIKSMRFEVSYEEKK